MGILENIWAYFLDNTYIVLFVGMLFGGETFLLPAVYLSIIDAVDIGAVVIIAAISTVISDTFWYFVGKYVPIDRILSWRLFKKKEAFIRKMLLTFEKHSLRIVFLSKFVYGTRTTAQILAGTVRAPFIPYLLTNCLGVFVYLGVIAVVGYATKESFKNFADNIYYGYVVFSVFIVIIIIINVCLKKFLQKKISPPSSPPGTKNGPSETS